MIRSAVASLYFLLFACPIHADEANTNTKDTVGDTLLHEERASECYGYPYSLPPDAVPFPNTEEHMHVSVDGDVLRIFHFKPWYPCKFTFAADYTVDGNYITVKERNVREVVEDNACMCQRFLQSAASGLKDGKYVVKLIHENGDVVGTDTAIIGGSPHLESYGKSSCLHDVPFPFPEQLFEYSYSNGTLNLENINAHLNCAHSLHMEFEQAQDTLRFYQVNLVTVPVPCKCPCDIAAEVSGVDPGEYVIEVYRRWLDNPYWLVNTQRVKLGD